MLKKEDFRNAAEEDFSSEEEGFSSEEESPSAEEEGSSSGNDEAEEQTEEIIKTGSITKTKGRYPIHCLTVVGQIEGHYILPPQNKSTKYEHVIPQLVAIEQDPDIKGLLIILNTVGGDVEAGLALAELISGMKKPTVSLVLGGGHSIGVPLACAAKVSYIAPSATMTIHPVRMNGLVLGVPQTLSYFDKMQERITNFVTANSRITTERFRELMFTTGELITDVGTVLDGEQAVAEGLIDRLGGLSDAIDSLYGQIEAKETKDSRRAVRAPKDAGEKPAPKGSPVRKGNSSREGSPAPEEGPAPGENPVRKETPDTNRPAGNPSAPGEKPSAEKKASQKAKKSAGSHKKKPSGGKEQKP